MEIEKPLEVTYKSTKNAYVASTYLSEIKNYSIIGADFETAVRYSTDDLQSFRDELDTDPPKMRRIELEAKLSATALDHPYHVALTHCSIGVSETEAYVFILDNKSITDMILNFLVTTSIKQVWHNLTYDAKFIYYHTGKFPINYEDTQILAKTLLNHVDTQKATTGLKELAGKWYGAWGISADNFTVDQMYEEHVLHYSAIDSCATLHLYNSIQKYIEEN